jgi:DNA-binding LytR/AlgR family response regulator
MKEKYLSKNSLAELIKVLPSQAFYKCHRSYCINLDFVNRLDMGKTYIWLKNKAKIPLSRYIKQDFMKLINEA